MMMSTMITPTSEPTIAPSCESLDAGEGSVVFAPSCESLDAGEGSVVGGSVVEGTVTVGGSVEGSVKPKGVGLGVGTVDDNRFDELV